MQIHLQLKKILFDKNLTIKEVAEKIDVSYPTLKRFFSGTQNLSHITFINLLTTLDCDIQSLVGRKTPGAERNRKMVLEDIGSLLCDMSPYKTKPLIRLVLNNAERSLNVNKKKIESLKKEFQRL